MTSPSATGTTHAPVTLVTGGSTGIGAETVRRLLGTGHRVVATGRDEAKLAALAERLGGPEGLATLAGDAADAAHVAAAVGEAVARFGRLDNVVANAGFSTHETVVDGDPDTMRSMLLTNVLGPALLIREAVPRLRESHGRIVLLGSVAGLKNSPGNFYSVTKWGVHALAENTRMQVTGDGIGVSLIAPGKVDTPFWEARGGMPAGPALTAGGVADAVVWVLAQPAGLDVNTVTLRPVGQQN